MTSKARATAVRRDYDRKVAQLDGWDELACLALDIAEDRLDPTDRGLVYERAKAAAKKYRDNGGKAGPK